MCRDGCDLGLGVLSSCLLSWRFHDFRSPSPSLVTVGRDGRESYPQGFRAIMTAMHAPLVALAAFLCLTVAAIAAMLIHPRLQPHHRDDET